MTKEISLEEAKEKIRSGLREHCECMAHISAGPEEPVGEEAEFVRLWFEDHSYEDLSKHGKLVLAKTQEMRKAAKK